MKQLILVLVGMVAACNAPALLSPRSGDSETPQPPEPPRPSPTAFHDVGTLGAWTAARALNDAGLVVGTSSPSQYGAYPINSQNGAVRRLEMFAGVVDAAMSGMAEAINREGTIAGTTGTDGVWYVTRWDTAGTRLSLMALPAAERAGVVEINDAGAVLAWWDLEPFKTRAVLVEGNTARPIGHLSGLSWTEPSDVNASSQVVGRSAFAYAPNPDREPGSDTESEWVFHHPFLWQNGKLQDLGVFGRTTHCTREAPCARGAALAINDAGSVVGYAEDAQLVQRAFLWRGGKLEDLGVFPGQRATARAINNRGMIAGDGAGGVFLWQNGTAQILGTLGGDYAVVTAMNENGDIVGTSLTASGEQHAFIYTGGRMVDLGVGMPDACAARAVDVNDAGDVLIAVMRECFHNLPDERLTNFEYVRPQLAVVWKHQ